MIKFFGWNKRCLVITWADPMWSLHWNIENGKEKDIVWALAYQALITYQLLFPPVYLFL